MADTTGNAAQIAISRHRPAFALVLLLGFHVIMCCASLTYAAYIYASPFLVDFDSARIGPAVLVAAPFIPVVFLFAVSRFSFGYFVGFCLYTVVLGYLWLIEFSVFPYEHRWSAVSVGFSGLFFLLPTLRTASPFRRNFTLSPRAFDRMLTAILILGAVLVVSGAHFNFELVGIDAPQPGPSFPAPLGAAIGATSMVLLPFAFAGFLLRGAPWRAAAALALLLLFHPVTETKLTLFGPIWLLFLILLSRVAEIRKAVVLSLAAPMAIGVLVGVLFKIQGHPYEGDLPFFGPFNFRVLTIPSLAIDIYNDFFSTHPITHFCQIGILKALVGCPYSEPLTSLIGVDYQIGNLSASLFAMEGVASVGTSLAPLSALVCGFVIALGNRASAGLPARFVLLSSGMLVQLLLSESLTTGMVSYGGALLFLLWWITPRTVFELPAPAGPLTRSIAALVSDCLDRYRLQVLLGLHVVVCCISLTYVAYFYNAPALVAFSSAGIAPAILTVLPFALAAVLFAVSRFSFGYFVGFYLYTIILGYLWLTEFSAFPYAHRWPAVSAFFCGLFFLLPALAAVPPLRQRFTLSTRAFEHALTAILLIGAATIAAGAIFNFRLIGVAEIYAFRNEIRFPAPMGYAMGVTTNVLLPFAFACFALRGERWRAAAALALILLFYPVTLTKMTLFAPFLLLFLTVVSRSAASRMTVVLSLCAPLALGVVLAALYQLVMIPYQWMIPVFGAINFRAIAVPALAIDIYNDFFTTHPVTHFCQISVLKSLVACPYSEPLAVLMEKNYHLGNLNASLFATEGIASVGPALAPLTAFASGLIVALGNRASAGLPPRFVLLSGAIAVQSFVNVPLSIALLTNGTAVLFLLWYVTPRTVFDEK